MQVTETGASGLLREFKVVIPASELVTPRQAAGRDGAQCAAERLPAGKGAGLVPEKDLWQVADERGRRSDGSNPANRRSRSARSGSPPPQVDFVNEIEDVVDGKADLEFTIAVDLMPDFAATDVNNLESERLIADVDDAEIVEAARAARPRRSAPTRRGRGRPGGGERSLTIDFEGKMDGEPFEGGKGEDVDRARPGRFHSRFRGTVVGAKAGEDRKVK